MRIRLRGPTGASTLTLDDDATIGDLRAHIRDKTGLTKYTIKSGYPPKPLVLEQDATLLTSLDLKLDGEQLTISSDGSNSERPVASSSAANASTESTSISASDKHVQPVTPLPAFSPSAPTRNTATSQSQASKPIALKKQNIMATDVPEIPLPDRGATLVMRVMPDDNSCLFRAFGTAVVPTDDQTMTELRSLIASAIQSNPQTYTKVVLEQEPDEYCKWIQTPDAWGGALELGILSKHFDIEICSIDVQSNRIDKFNEGRPTRCILVYSGIHYDTIVQSPSEYPYTKADAPPEFDRRVWDSDDDVVLFAALDLCEGLKAKHYFTDTGGMSILCKDCGWVGYGQGQAAEHATRMGHYDMEEVRTARK